MSKLAGLAGGPTLAIAGAVAAAIVGGSLYFSGAFTPSAPVEEQPVAQVQPEAQEAAEPAKPAVQEADAETVTAAASTPKELPKLPDAPSIDTYRLEPDGRLLVAGQSDPEWDTSILVDGKALVTVSPDGRGQFVEFLDLAQDDQPRILSLQTRSADGAQKVTSAHEIILAPTPKPKAVAGEAEADLAQQDSEVAKTPEADISKNEPPTIAESTAETQEPTPKKAATPAVLLADESGVRVLQAPVPADAAPAVMSNVALDAITYSEAGQVQLTGRAQGAGFVRVYLDNAPVTSSRIEENGSWRSDLPEVDTGVYTLRIDEVDDQGLVTSRVETPFKREDEELVAKTEAATKNTRISAVTVQPGSTLWAISREVYGDGVLYIRVFEANSDRIRDPDLIYPGQVFTLPE